MPTLYAPEIDLACWCLPQVVMSGGGHIFGTLEKAKKGTTIFAGSERRKTPENAGTRRKTPESRRKRQKRRADFGRFAAPGVPRFCSGALADRLVQNFQWKPQHMLPGLVGCQAAGSIQNCVPWRCLKKLSWYYRFVITDFLSS